MVSGSQDEGSCEYASGTTRVQGWWADSAMVVSVHKKRLKVVLFAFGIGVVRDWIQCLPKRHNSLSRLVDRSSSGGFGSRRVGRHFVHWRWDLAVLRMARGLPQRW